MRNNLTSILCLTSLIFCLSCCSLVHLDGIIKPPADAIKALNTVLEILEQDGWQDKVMLDQPTMYDCGSCWTVIFPYPEGSDKLKLTVIIDKKTGEIRRIKST
jgi:hypothetical protein